MGVHGPFQWAEEGGEACGTWFFTPATDYSPWEVRESPDDQISSGPLNQNLSGEAQSGNLKGSRPEELLGAPVTRTGA